MDFRDTPDEAAFRAELRAWLRDHRPSEWQPDTDPKRERWGLEQSRAWSRRLFQAGYMGLTWPKEHGGQAAPYTHQAILLEEIARAEAPEHVGIIGLAMAGPTLIAHGTEAQKKAHLDKILSADEIFCQGFSEPGAGSDLASLRTRAERDGDGFVLNGQKVWSSFAHIADWCILLARTNPDASKHQGLTYFLVDMHAPGVEVRPLRQLTGDPEFNEIFLTDVRVPADQVVGEVDGGWGVAMTTLLHERGTLGFALTVRLEVTLRKLVRLARRSDGTGRRAADDPLVRDRVARLWIDLQGLRYTNYRALTSLVRTGIPGPEGSVAKLHWSESNQRLGKLALEVLGTAAQLDGGDSVWGGYWQYQQLRSRGNTIEAGTSEVLRNIIAERVLGLPRSR
jgi:alkylation response protein AidB-like acyl-CoA dehydrogenase